MKQPSRAFRPGEYNKGWFLQHRRAGVLRPLLNHHVRYTKYREDFQGRFWSYLHHMAGHSCTPWRMARADHRYRSKEADRTSMRYIHWREDRLGR